MSLLSSGFFLEVFSFFVFLPSFLELTNVRYSIAIITNPTIITARITEVTDVSGDVSTNPEDKGGVDFDKISKILKEWWQVIASGISIVLIIIFTCKGASNLSKAKKAKKATENRYKAYYAEIGRAHV